MKSKKSLKKSFKKLKKTKKIKRKVEKKILNSGNINGGSPNTYYEQPVLLKNQNLSLNRHPNELNENNKGFIMPQEENKENSHNQSLYETFNPTNINIYNTSSSSQKILTAEQFNKLMKYIKNIFSTKITQQENKDIINLFDLLIESKRLEDLLNNLKILSNNNKSSNSLKIEIDNRNAYFTLDEFLNILQKIKKEFETFSTKRTSINNILLNNNQKKAPFNEFFDNYFKKVSFFLFLLEKFILKLKENNKSINNESNENKPLVQILKKIQDYRHIFIISMNNEITDTKINNILIYIKKLLNEKQLQEFKEICKIFGINIT